MTTPAPRHPAVPVILLTGYLGAGKTSLLNHLLRHPDSRIGVVVNDFGDLNIDAGLVVGQVNEPFSISGGCICCIDDDGSLEDALVALADPKLRLDAILVEASGFAEPLTLARMVSRLGRHRFHLGGVVDVVDALMHAATVDVEPLPPVRYAATTLVVVNKLDQIPAPDRDGLIESIRQRVHQRNPRVLVVGTAFGRIDPTLILDPGAGDGEKANPDDGEPWQAELPLRELLREAYAEREEKLRAEALGTVAGVEDQHGDGGGLGHRHAQSVTVTGSGPVDAHAVMDFLEDLPPGVYRVKGAVTVWDRGRRRAFGVQAVGPNVYVSTAVPTLRVPGGSDRRGECDLSGAAGPGEWDSALVVIGQSFHADDVRSRLERALDPQMPACAGTDSPGDGESVREGLSAVERFLHYVRLHA
ncbi:G3E family GTPase [Brevibacterium sanguinis]|uniref:G3E family GTPase n=2 Tax=Brevibacterium TaxID=1696 RepID=A0A366IQE1_9MICO|nr:MULTISPECIES: CobW family GTP-binding protein [Brevibacterium]RBP61682.1 G3E family GTPase [Brevibacterium sanguinis]RBP74337.1 G3E family GTPase [Brevibacterium celere]